VSRALEVRVARSSVADGAALRVDAGHDGVCLVRVGDDFYALCDRCSHANVPLSEGEVDPEELTVECWKHGSTFSLVDGKPQCLPATKAVPTYQVRIEGDEVVVVVK
jgi:3-phenylpropionate/trans-cinnamate dioxygenase ferredoxin subunit